MGRGEWSPVGVCGAEDMEERRDALLRAAGPGETRSGAGTTGPAEGGRCIFESD